MTDHDTDNREAADINLPPEQLLDITLRLLDGYLLAPDKAKGKQRFRELLAGEPAKLAELEVNEESSLRFALALDSSEYIGKLSFSPFKKHLQSLLGQIMLHLKDKKLPSLMSDESGTRNLLKVAGHIPNDDKGNILMLTYNSSMPGIMILELQFFEPSQFQQAAPSPED